MSKKLVKILGIIAGVLFFIFIVLWIGKVSSDRILAEKERDRLQKIETAKTEDSLAKIEQTSYKELLRNLSVSSKFTNNELQIFFSPFNFANEFIFDRYSLVYSTRWYYRQAERGSTFLISIATVTSKSKNPNLPGIYAYYLDSTGTHLISQFEYRFYFWTDYSTYLGNYHETTNDFAYTETIKFDLGALIDEKYKQLPILIVASNDGRFIRETDRFGSPPISYKSQYTPSENLKVTDLKKNYTVIQLLNKQKLDELQRNMGN